MNVTKSNEINTLFILGIIEQSENFFSMPATRNVLTDYDRGNLIFM